MGYYLNQLTQEQLKVVDSLMEMPDSKIKPDYRRIDLTDQSFGDWVVLKYAGKKKWICMCSCGKIAKVAGTELRLGNSTSCGHNNNNKNINLVGQTFGYWEVLEKLPKNKYRCKCHCGCPGGTIKIVGGYDLQHGKTKSCGYNTTRKESIVGRKFNSWTVLEYIGEGKYKCQCDCEDKTIGIVRRADLVSGRSKSCGHDTNKLIDLTGRKFGEWTVIKHVGYGRWLCRCSCPDHTEKIIRHTELLNGDSKSCGCKHKELLKQTMIDRYGETASSKINSPRTLEQIDAIKDKESMLSVIKNNFDHKPTVYELEPIFGLKYSRIIRLIHQYGLEDSILLYDTTTSRYETEIINFIHTIDQDIKIIHSDRVELSGNELDIYIPDKKLAIEFDGNYWHSDLFKDNKYHQHKSIRCFRRGIRCIHIFEHEWNNPIKQRILKWLIEDRISTNKNIVYARNCTITLIDNNLCQDFLSKNHIQGGIYSDICLGLYYNSELIGVMTFGRPRFNEKYEYELLRLAWKQGVNVVGGSERLFKYFVTQYKPTSIVSYCDIGKFSGDVYLRLGFKATSKDITTPNYLWVNPITNKTLTRYQTMKHKLIEKGLGTPDMTEADIMESLGYIRIYDCGNMRFSWYNT